MTMENNPKPPLYNAKGEIADLEVARDAANVEKEYHKKTLGIFPPSKEKIRKGELEAELAIEKGKEIKKEELPPVVRTELDKYEERIKKHFAENASFYDDSGVTSLDKIIEADIGGGITRYRVFYSVDYSTADVLNNITIARSNLPAEYQLIVDFKDGQIIN